MSLFLLSKLGFSGSGSLARPTGQMRSAGTAFRQHGINAMGSPRILQFSPSRFGLYHFPRFYGLWSFSECFGIEVHWERFNLCSLLSSQECRTGCTDPTSAAVQGDTCTAFQSTILRGAGWDRTRRLERKKAMRMWTWIGWPYLISMLYISHLMYVCIVFGRHWVCMIIRVSM